MRSRRDAVASLIALAAVFALVGLMQDDDGWFVAAGFLAFGAMLVQLLGPTPEQLGARRRARAPKYFHARPIGGRR